MLYTCLCRTEVNICVFYQQNWQGATLHEDNFLCRYFSFIYILRSKLLLDMLFVSFWFSSVFKSVHKYIASLVHWLLSRFSLLTVRAYGGCLLSPVTIQVALMPLDLLSIQAAGHFSRESLQLSWLLTSSAYAFVQKMDCIFRTLCYIRNYYCCFIHIATYMSGLLTELHHIWNTT